MEEKTPYSTYDDVDTDVQMAAEPVAAYVAEAMPTPDQVAYAHIVDGVLQVTADIEEEMAAADRGETVTLDEFKTMFARWIDR